MPKIKLSPEKLAVAHMLHGEGWTHGRIGALFSVERSTITYALSQRKTHLPSQMAERTTQVLAAVLVRTQRAGLTAIAAELKACAAELDAELTSRVTPTA